MVTKPALILNNRHYRLKLYLVKDLTEGIYLDLDFMERYKISINFDSDHLTMGGQIL
jgi:hypothetical protein